MGAAVRWSVAEGILTGFPDQTFRPGQAVQRGHLARWLWVLDGRPDGDPPTGLTDVDGTWSEEAVRWAVAEGIARGLAGGRRFDPGAPLSRAQAATWLHAWAAPRLPRVELVAELTDTNLLTVSWEVSNSLHTLAPEVDVEPLVGRRTASCGDGPGCSAVVRTSQPGVNRLTVTVRNTDGGLTQASTEVVVPRPASPVVGARYHRIDPFAAPAPAQVLTWARPPGVPAAPPVEQEHVRIRRADSIFPLAEKFPVDGTFALTGPNRATTAPVGWSIQYCHEPEPGRAALCSRRRTGHLRPEACALRRAVPALRRAGRGGRGDLDRPGRPLGGRRPDARQCPSSR